MPEAIHAKPAQAIPYGRQTVGQEEIDAVIEVLKSPFITQGPAIERFEKAVAEYCNVAYAVAFCNGTAALHAAYAAAGISPGDEAVTTPLTFVATSNALLFHQAKPVFSDIDPLTLNLDMAAAAEKITSRTRAIIPVHFAGQPVDLDACYALADKHNLVVIEDGCHALGARYQGQAIGQCRDMAVFSFHPVKSITTGEGGMVVTPHKHYYEKLLQFRSHGIVRNAEQFNAVPVEPWAYEMQTLGWNYRLTDMQAAMGVVQMSKLDGFIERRTVLAERYQAAFQNEPALILQQPLPNVQSAHHLFIIQINPRHTAITRRQLFDRLVEANIRPQVHYMPIHLHPYYQQALGTKLGDYPHAEQYYNHCLSLPLYPLLADDEQDYIIDTVKTSLKH